MADGETIVERERKSVFQYKSRSCHHNFNRQSTDNLPTDYQQTADRRPTVGRQSADRSLPLWKNLSADRRPTVGRLSAVCVPTVGRLSAVCRPTVGRLSADSWPTVGGGELFFTFTIKDMLDEMCDDAKHQMKELSSDQIGSWSSCCDGCWLIWGHFSQNCTFVIKNYITGALLYYGHLSMRGADRICDEDLWQGTAKSAEGHLSQQLWAQAKEEGLKVEINWQDADS